MSTGPISANTLAAFYNPRKGVLTLYADGEVQPITDNIHFVRQPWFGGLKYELIGTCYAIGKPPEPYKHHQPERVSVIPFPRDVIIVTSNHPQGKAVRILWEGIKPPEGKENEAGPDGPSSQDGSGPTVQLASGGQDLILAFVDTPFSIKQASQVPAMGSVSLDFDTNYLNLANAGIQNTDIVWSLVPRKLGKTQVTVTIYGGIAQYVARIVYNVLILVREDEN